MSEALSLRKMQGADLTPDEADDLFAPEFTETTHGFVLGDILYRSSLAAHAKAVATARSTLAVGIVVDVPDVNTFSLFSGSGKALTFTTHGLGSFGAEFWLHQSTAGDAVTTEPASGWYQYLGYVLDANTIYWEPHKLAVELL